MKLVKKCSGCGDEAYGVKQAKKYFSTRTQNGHEYYQSCCKICRSKINKIHAAAQKEDLNLNHRMT